MQKEVETVNKVKNSKPNELVVFFGGKKISDKMQVLDRLVQIADKIHIGGAMSYTFFKAKGLSVGNSLVDEPSIEYCRELLKKYSNKIVLPKDTVVADRFPDGENDKVNAKTVKFNEIPDGWEGLDIGEETVKEMDEALRQKGKTILWCGPLGVFENPQFAKGTKSIVDSMVKNNSNIIVGGGDSAAAAKKEKLHERSENVYISTGGGAFLEGVSLEKGEELPGVAATMTKEQLKYL